MSPAASGAKRVALRAVALYRQHSRFGLTSSTAAERVESIAWQDCLVLDRSTTLRRRIRVLLSWQTGRPGARPSGESFHTVIIDGSLPDAMIADMVEDSYDGHYLDEPSSLSDTLERSADFFGLFDDFAGYVDFFQLQDLVNEPARTVRFFTPFEDFVVVVRDQQRDAAVSALSRAPTETGRMPRVARAGSVGCACRWAAVVAVASGRERHGDGVIDVLW
jgi:hypothetical protein